MIISITIDDRAGGIAESLVSYSKALEIINENHLIILPDKANVIEVLEKISNVQLVKIPKYLLKFHTKTKFFFHNHIKGLLKKSKYIFIHNSKLILYLNKFENKVALINHSGRLTNLNHKGCNIFLTSSAMKRFLKKFPLNEAKNIIIPHGFSEPQLGFIDSSSNIKNLRVIAAGRFIEKKGFEVLIKAAYLIKKRNLDIKIKIYGKGPLEKKFKNKIKKYKLTNVSLCGWTSNLNEAFKQSDVFCIPSFIEPFGLVIGEAMACGLPVIASNTDGAKEIFGSYPENNGGIIVSISSPDELMKAMIKMQNKNFRDKLSKLGKKNIRKNFSLNKLALNLKKII